jgi:uncharacterized membrane protein YraQ (UPF0718 family)
MFGNQEVYHNVLNLFIGIFRESWQLLLETSVYLIFGIIVGGLFRVFLSPASVMRHLGQGRFTSVVKAAFLGIPMPLCSCGVLPAAVSLHKQGANKGATAAFLVSTPESGVDSIAITYALLDPIMTVARPVVAFFSAIMAGMAENLLSRKQNNDLPRPDLSCTVDACCDGIGCPPEVHRRHHSFLERTQSGISYAFRDVWGDLAGWFFIGLLLAGFITSVVPDEWFTRYLGGGLPSMLIMLAFGIPMYICASASTPIAAALILKGISPGTALVFLLVGPATNVTSLSVLLGVLGKRATVIYLSTIAFAAVLFGIILDQIYGALGISAQAVIGQAAEIIPVWARWAGTVFLLLLSVKPVWRGIKAHFQKTGHSRLHEAEDTGSSPADESIAPPCAGST